MLVHYKSTVLAWFSQHDFILKYFTSHTLCKHMSFKTHWLSNISFRCNIIHFLHINYLIKPNCTNTTFFLQIQTIQWLAFMWKFILLYLVSVSHKSRWGFNLCDKTLYFTRRHTGHEFLTTLWPILCEISKILHLSVQRFAFILKSRSVRAFDISL
jgi:hypothetical protein